MTECIKCGSCCNPVVLDEDNKLALDIALTHPYMVDDLDTKKNANFAARNWQLIGTVQESNKNFYAFACRFYDKNTKLCMAHDKRPPLCNAFPGSLTKDSKLPKGCSFWQDVPGWKPSIDTFIPDNAIQLPIVEIKGGSK